MITKEKTTTVKKEIKKEDSAKREVKKETPKKKPQKRKAVVCNTHKRGKRRTNLVILEFR